ncbi:MAG: PKD domain-containing protein [Pseudomonadota bacterium]
MTIAPITSNGPTITVSTIDDLYAAYAELSYQSGGGTIVVEPGYYGVMGLDSVSKVDGEEPVIIKSADPDDPAHFARLNLTDTVNVRIESIYVNSTGVDRPGWHVDVTAKGAVGLQIVDSTFIYDEDNALKDAGEIGETLEGFSDTTDVLFSGNYISGYKHGIGLSRATNFEVTNNEFTNIQGDGIRGGVLQDGIIANNYFHDFYPIEQKAVHTDFIQVWGVNGKDVTKNLTIEGNVMIATEAATQSIFIRNEDFGKADKVASGYHQDITIKDNLIYNAHPNGIRVESTDGLLIDGNTLLWNPEANVTPTSPSNYVPMINSRNSIDVTITNNITPRFGGSNIDTEYNNQIITYDNPQASDYVGKHFADPFAGKQATLADFFVLETSPFFGTAGSPIGNVPTDFSDGATAIVTSTASADDRYEITFDASGSVDDSGATLAGKPGYTYNWTFDDGSTATGISVTKVYDDGGFKPVLLEIRKGDEVVANVARNATVETKELFAFDFEDGIVDTSDAAPTIFKEGDLVSHNGSTALRIGQDNDFAIEHETSRYAAFDSFGLAFDLTPLEADSEGSILHHYGSIRASVDDDGHFNFRLKTDVGVYEMSSREPVFDDGGTHRIGIAYSNETGQLEMFADGESVSSMEAWGTLAETGRAFHFGHMFYDTMDAIVDNIEMSLDPSVAGDLPQVTPGTRQPLPPEDPPNDASNPPPVDTPPDRAPQPSDDDAPPGGDRGAPPKAFESDGGGGNFLQSFFDMILRVFGLGGGDDDERTASRAPQDQSADAMLSDIVPAVSSAEDAEVCDCAEDDDGIEAAA